MMTISLERGACRRLPVVQMMLLGCAAWPTMAPASIPTAVSPAPTSDASEQGIQDIVVTAQRRQEKLQSVPVAVTAFDGGQLTRLGIDGSKQLSQVTPGLNFTQSVFSPQPTIRGIGTRGVGAGDESVVPIYIDGVYQPFLAGADLQFNNVERIEVLKGPQSTLFGRNATAGAINIITKDPTAEPHGAINLSYGNFRDIVAKGYAGAGWDKLAAGLAFVTHRNDGYVRDIVNGARYGRLDDVSLRGKVVAKPSEGLTVRIAGGYVQNNDSTGEAYGVLNNNTVGARIRGNPYGNVPFTSALSIDPYNRLRQYSVSGTAILDLDPVTITSLTGYQNDSLDINADSDASLADLNGNTYNQRSKNLYHETYLTTNGTGPFSAIAGFVYYHEKAYYGFYNSRSTTVSATGVIGATSVTSLFPSLKTDSYAGYAQASWKPTATLTLTAGGRYTIEHRSISTSGRVGATLFGPIDTGKTFSKFTPSAIIQWQPSRTLNIYAKYGEAFKSGIFNATASTAPSLRPVQPENVKQYEVGVKSDPTSWLRINLAGYYTNYKDLQSSARDPISLTSFTQNAGGARIYGAELDVIVRPTSRLRLRSGLAALHGTYRNFPNATATLPATTVDPTNAALCAAGTGTPNGGNRSVTCDVSGNKIIRTPFFTANGGIDYTIPVGNGEIGVVGNAYYSGHSYWDTLNRLREPSYVLINGELSWRPGRDKLRIAIWGANLLNEKYSLTQVSSASGDIQVMAQPRTYGVRFSYEF